MIRFRDPGGPTVDAVPTKSVIRSSLALHAGYVPAGARVLTGHEGAATAVGVRHVSPAHHALRILVRSGGRVAGRLMAWRTLNRAIDEVAPGADPVGLRRSLIGPVRELLRAGLDDVPTDAGISSRARTALRVARRYRALLEDAGETDPAELFWAAGRAGARAPGVSGPVAVVGVQGVGADVCDFLTKVAGEGSVVVLGPEDDRSVARLERAGWVVREDPSEASTLGERLAGRFLGGAARAAGRLPSTGAAAYGFGSQEEELRWVLARVKSLLRLGVPAGDVVVAARDDAAVSAAVEAVAWELGVPVRALHPVPLSETRLGGWVDALREVQERALPYEETARLLAHRITGGWSAETAQAARTEHPVGARAWAEVDPRAAVLAWPESDMAGAWAARLDESLAAFGVGERVDVEPRDAAVLETLRGAVADACRPAERVLTRRAFLRDLGDILTLWSVRKDPAPGPGEEAVELRPLRSLAGSVVPHLFVLGATEGTLPAALRDDPVLDFHDRSRLAASGVPLAGAADRARDEEAAFAAALRSVTREVVWTVAARSGGRSQLPSPYLARLGVAVAAAPPMPPASPEERRRRLLRHEPAPDEPDEILPRARAAWLVERRRESAQPHDEYDGVAGLAIDPATRPLSATQITELGQCAFRWFAHRVLSATSPDEAEETLSPRLRGDLWHAALQHAGAEGMRRANRPSGSSQAGDAVREAVLEALPAAFERAEREVGVPVGPAWDRIRQGELRALERAVRSEDFLAPGAVPLAFERPFRGRWRGLVVRGTVDRIDLAPGGVELIDYKSGTSAPRGAKDASGWGWVDVQLPLYLEAAAPELVPGHPLAAARYLSVRSGETLRTFLPGADDARLQALALRVRAHLAQGSFPVDPDPRRLACANCDLQAVCRVGPRVDRKRDAAAEAARAHDGGSPAPGPRSRRLREEAS